MNVEQVLQQVRDAISESDRSISEKDLYEALVAEAEGWKMRLEELEAEEEMADWPDSDETEDS
jgi:hypothetical protein